MSGSGNEARTQTDEGFLSRWSRLKRQPTAETTEAQTEAPADSSDNENRPPLTDADMPPLDSLTEESDFSGFLSPEVSEELRQVALRKLFRSALFNTRDGLDDYDDDFTSFEKLGDLITSDMRHQMEQEAKRLAEANDEAETEEAAAEAQAVEPEETETPTAEADEQSDDADDLTEESL